MAPYQRIEANTHLNHRNQNWSTEVERWKKTFSSTVKTCIGNKNGECLTFIILWLSQYCTVVHIPKPITTFPGGPTIPDTLIRSPSARMNNILCSELLAWWERKSYTVALAFDSTYSTPVPQRTAKFYEGAWLIICGGLIFSSYCSRNFAGLGIRRETGQDTQTYAQIDTCRYPVTCSEIRDLSLFLTGRQKINIIAGFLTCGRTLTTRAIVLLYSVWRGWVFELAPLGRDDPKTCRWSSCRAGGLVTRI